MHHARTNGLHLRTTLDMVVPSTFKPNPSTIDHTFAVVFVEACLHSSSRSSKRHTPIELALPTNASSVSSPLTMKMPTKLINDEDK